HRLYSWLFPKFGLSVIARHPQYFLLKAASIVIWFGLLMLFSAWFLPVPMTDSSARDLAYIDEHPWLLIVGGLVLGLMVRRHNRMREIAARQIYPSMAARFIVNVGTFVTPFALLFGLGLFLRFWI